MHLRELSIFDCTGPDAQTHSRWCLCARVCLASLNDNINPAFSFLGDVLFGTFLLGGNVDKKGGVVVEMGLRWEHIEEKG